MLKLMAFRASPLSFGRIDPRITIERVTPLIPRERPNGKHSFAGYWLPQPTPAPALRTALATQLSGGTRVRHWQSFPRL